MTLVNFCHWVHQYYATRINEIIHAITKLELKVVIIPISTNETFFEAVYNEMPIISSEHLRYMMTTILVFDKREYIYDFTTWLLGELIILILALIIN